MRERDKGENGWLLMQTPHVPPLVANALVGGCRGCRWVYGYSWARCSMVAATR